MRTTDEMIEFMLEEFGADIILNGLPAKALFEHINQSSKFAVQIRIKTAVRIQTGDLVEYRGDVFIITSDVSHNGLAYTATMTKALHIFKFSIGEQLYEVNAIISAGTFDLNEGKHLVTEEGRIEIIVVAAEETRAVVEGLEFISMGRAWKVVGVDMTKPGLILLTCDKVLLSTNDDIAAEIKVDDTAANKEWW